MSAIMDLQKELLKYPQVEVETNHHFADGMYAREVWRPADTTIVGKVHKKEHLFAVIEGMITIVDDQGSQTYCAPYIGVSRPGTKRATYAHVASRFVTFHRLDNPLEKDLEKIEAQLVEVDADCQYLPGNVLRLKAIEK